MANSQGLYTVQHRMLLRSGLEAYRHAQLPIAPGNLARLSRFQRRLWYLAHSCVVHIDELTVVGFERHSRVDLRCIVRAQPSPIRAVNDRPFESVAVVEGTLHRDDSAQAVGRRANELRSRHLHIYLK